MLLNLLSRRLTALGVRLQPIKPNNNRLNNGGQLKSIAVILVGAFFMTVSGAAQYKLEYKASSPASLHYKAHTTVLSTQSMMGQETKYSIVSDQAITLTSTRADSELVYSTTIDSGENLVVLPSGDTNKTPSPAVGKIKETRISADGRELSSRWLDTTFANTPAAQTREFGNFFVKLPEGSVDTGATWNQNRADTVGVPGGQGKIVVNTNTDYKLVGKEEVGGIPCARIEYTGKVSLKGQASIQGMDLAIDGSGTISGSALFDYGNGRVVNINGSSNQDLIMASSGENAMTIPTSQKTSYELFLAK